MKLGITGAGGKLGGNVVNHLSKRARAADIVAITRQPDKLASVTAQGIDVRAGDFNEPAGLAKAFAGIDRLLIIPTGDLTPGVRPRHHRDAILAAVKAGVGHITYISSLGCKPGKEDGILETHWATEQVLINSGSVWTLLRMGPYAESLLDAAKNAVASGVYSAMNGAPAAWVVREDIAAAAAGILATEGHDGITYFATGPVSITPPEVAATISKVLGKPVRFEPLSAEQQQTNLNKAGLPPFLISPIIRFQTASRDGAFDLVSGDIGRLSGKRAESPEEFLMRNKSAFLGS